MLDLHIFIDRDEQKHYHNGQSKEFSKFKYILMDNLPMCGQGLRGPIYFENMCLPTYCAGIECFPSSHFLQRPRECLFHLSFNNILNTSNTKRYWCFSILLWTLLMQGGNYDWSNALYVQYTFFTKFVMMV